MGSPGLGARGVVPFLVAGGVLGAPLGGCGSGSPTLDTATVERAVAASIRTQRGVPTTVRCPAHVKRSAGVSFTCTASLDVGAYPVAVTVTDGSGHVIYGNQAPLVALNVTKVERAIASSILAQRHLRALVLCPATVLQKAGLRFTCTATIAGRRYPFEVTEVDGGGRVQYVGR